MTTIIVAILLIGYLAIATEHITRINKAAVAMFLGVTGWILYMVDGSEYISRFYAADYQAFLDGTVSTAATVKSYIANQVFLLHVANISQIVLYLLATMAIVEVLNSNGCFDFITDWIRTRNGKRLLWYLVLITFFLSANLDNLTTTVMMLMIMRKIVSEKKYRMYLGSAIVIAANCGGCVTVIGDINSLMLWVKEAVTPGSYSTALFLPSLVAMVIPSYLISRKIPEHIDVELPRIIYRGDDSVLSYWQRGLMLFVGIGGLWFIPTFHSITKLPPFVGALCVLAVFWVVNELMNSSLIKSNQPVSRTFPRTLQYENLQTILYFIGISLAVGAIKETGAFAVAAEWINIHVHNIYVVGVVFGFISAILDNIAIVLSSISMYDVIASADLMPGMNWTYVSYFMQNGEYWKLIAFCGAVGGCLLPIGSIAGYALMKSEKVLIWWYFRMISGKVLAGWIAGLLVYFIVNMAF